MTGPKTNERPGTRAQLRHCGMSAYKARQVLDLIRGVELGRAEEILQFCDRDAARVIGKLVHSAASNAEQNDELSREELYVSACYADEGTTMKRWRPRARGRASRIRKRTCHITVIVSRLPEGEIQRRRAKEAAEAADRRARRVAGTRRSRRLEAQKAAASSDEAADVADDIVGDDETVADDASVDVSDGAGHEGIEDEIDEDEGAAADDGAEDEAVSQAEGAATADGDADLEAEESAEEEK
jgi:large subunit ribosomal protein L22